MGQKIKRSYQVIDSIRFVDIAYRLDRQGLWLRDDVIASDLAFSREHSVADDNPVFEF